MASAVTTAIDALTAVVKEGIDNSKIINMLDKEISRALGLLVDLILLPFMPLLVWALITLYTAVIALGKAWGDFIKTAIPSLTEKVIDKNAPGGAGRQMSKDFGLDWIIDIALPIIVGALIAGLLIALGVSAGWAIVGGAIIALLTMYLVQEAYKFGDVAGAFFYKLGKDFGFWVVEAGKAFGTLINQINTAVYEAKLGLEEFYKLIVGFFTFGWASDYLTGVMKQIDLLFIALGEIGKAWDMFWEGIAKTISSIDIGAWLKGVVSGGWIPGFASGGYVNETGLAIVHKGETITPEGKGGNHTFNFYGYQDDKFIAKVRDVMRGDATRYSQ
jgi:hypothetical protein